MKVKGKNQSSNQQEGAPKKGWCPFSLPLKHTKNGTVKHTHTHTHRYSSWRASFFAQAAISWKALKHLTFWIRVFFLTPELPFGDAKKGPRFDDPRLIVTPDSKHNCLPDAQWSWKKNGILVGWLTLKGNPYRKKAEKKGTTGQLGVLLGANPPTSGVVA